jgi:hypothetical protein
MLLGLLLFAVADHTLDWGVLGSYSKIAVGVVSVFMFLLLYSGGYFGYAMVGKTRRTPRIVPLRTIRVQLLFTRLPALCVAVFVIARAR